MKKIPYLMHEDAVKLKATAVALLEFKDSATIAVDCAALLSLIEQAHSPQLGLATTKEMRDELTSRGPDSPDDYKTFNPQECSPEPCPVHGEHSP